MDIEAGRTLILKLRATIAEPDALAFQMRLSRAVSASTLQPRGLPPSAILFVRTLRDPLPGALDLQPNAMRPPARWEQAVAASLDQLARQAARPAREAVPAGVEAVLFHDHSELLTSLTADWCGGSALAHWWWQTLFRNTDVAQAILAAWRAKPEYIPAALEGLAAQRRAVEFVQRLDQQSVLGLLDDVTRSFDLHSLRSALDTALNYGQAPMAPNAMAAQALPSWPIDTPSVARARAEPFQHVAPGPAQAAANTGPWGAWAPECTADGLTPGQQAFLGIGLMLRRAPNVVRTSAFAGAVAEWPLATGEFDPTRNAAPGLPAPELSRLGSESLASSLNSGDIQSATAQTSAMSDHAPKWPANGAARAAASSSAKIAELSWADVGPADLATAPSTSTRALSQDVRKTADRSAPAAENLKPAPADLAIPAVDLPPPVIVTALGGLFYFINLALYLGLYGDFTSPAEPGLALSPWDFVALVGREMLGEDSASDPVWALLARLAGRGAGVPPGQDFAAPTEWRLPHNWLAPFPENTPWEWMVDDGRLLVTHAANFVITDMPRSAAEVHAQLQDELRPYASAGQVHPIEPRAPLATRRQSPAARWLGWLVPYVRARLQRALGSAEDQNAGRIVIEQPARVFVTATHLDVVFALSELPIEIRLAGLDRNPGWVPAAGRFITFHFE